LKTLTRGRIKVKTFIPPPDPEALCGFLTTHFPVMGYAIPEAIEEQAGRLKNWLHGKYAREMSQLRSIPGIGLLARSTC
jgi:hypothetical protein